MSEPDAKVLNAWATNGQYTELDEKAEAFSINGNRSFMVSDSCARGFYIGWVSGQKEIVSERDNALAMVKELTEASKELTEAIRLEFGKPLDSHSMNVNHSRDKLLSVITKAEAML